MDRLRRAETLARLSSWAPEARLAIARAAVEARQTDRARDALRPLIEERPSVRVCLAMAEIEGTEGNAGRVREWLARAARAPRDKAWIADGVVSETWAPISPVSGRLDAFVWDTPPEVLGSSVEPERLSFAGEETEERSPGLALPPVAAKPDASDAGSPEAEPEPPAEVAASPAPASAAVDVPSPPPPRAEPEAAPIRAETPSQPPPAKAEPVAADPPRRGRPNGSAFPAREPAPVVFPVAHPPDDPGAEEAEAPRPRLRFRG
jgi:HemY protein